MEIFLGTPEALLGDIDQMEAHFNPFGDSINLYT
jgi:hypothetical protein